MVLTSLNIIYSNRTVEKSSFLLSLLYMAALLWGKAERAQIIQPEEEETQGNFISVYKYVKEGCKEDKRQWAQIGAQEVPLGSR